MHYKKLNNISLYISLLKILGIISNRQLKWTDNVDMMVKKASERLYILHVLRRSGILSSDFLPVYYSLLRSILKYSCGV